MKTLKQITEREILALPAGEQLDALVVEARGGTLELMGSCLIARDKDKFGEPLSEVGYSGGSLRLGEMLEWLGEQRYYYHLISGINDVISHCFAVFNIEGYAIISIERKSGISHAVALAVAVLGKRQLSSKD